MIRTGFILLFIVSVIAPIPIRAERLEPVQFSREFSAVDGSDLNMGWRETRSIQHFLGHVFPLRQMRRFEGISRPGGDPPATPVFKSIDYAMVEQQGYRFAIVHFQAAWDSGDADATSVLAVYRIEPNGPNQVWRSEPWRTTYRGFHFQTAKSGWRNIVLFEEGGQNEKFGLAGVFSFYNAPKGLYIRELTPALPRLRAVTRFPIRPMLARDIMLQGGGTNRELTLRASDEAFDRSLRERVRTISRWIFNRRRDAFESSRIEEEAVR